MTSIRERLSGRVTLVIAALALVAMVGSAAYAALGIGDLLKVFGIGFVVKQYSRQMDTFINKALGEHNAAVRGATKVVPILSVGGGGFIGAAQIVGVPAKVQTVKAVAQVEARFQDRFRMRVLIPISTESASGTPKGVGGVGVSAVLDFGI